MGSADVSGDYINGAYIRALALEDFNYATNNGGAKIQFAAQSSGISGNMIPIAEFSAVPGAGFLGLNNGGQV